MNAPYFMHPEYQRLRKENAALKAAAAEQRGFGILLGVVAVASGAAGAALWPAIAAWMAR